MNRALLLLALLAIATHGLEAQSPSPRSLLLRLDETATSTFACDGNTKEILIFGDGLVVRQTLEDRGSLAMRRQVSSQPNLARLTAALVTGQIGFLRGSCASDIFTPNAEFTTKITWFGRPPRRSTLVVGSAAQPLPPCTSAVNVLFREILTFLSAAAQDPLATSASVPVLPAPGCEGPPP
jgi:hypothetical protein